MQRVGDQTLRQSAWEHREMIDALSGYEEIHGGDEGHQENGEIRDQKHLLPF